MGSGDSEEAKITNVILTSLVDIRSYGVIVVAATNYLDKLDGAAIREGRFDFKVEITSPDAEARASLINGVLLNYKGIRLSVSALSQSTKRWEGFSVARIRAVVDEACRTAKTAGNQIVDYPAMQAALRLTQGSQGDAIPPNTPLLDDVIMPDDQLSKLKGIAHRMKHIEEVEDLGGTVPTGILFWGPPGTGKTMTIRSLAKTTEWALKSVSGSDLMADMNKVDEIASFAKHNRPCIIFIDEADDVLGHRGMSGGSATALTNKLLATIDGAKGKTPDVMWVAATNNPDSLDEAAMRGGRFTEKIEFSAPDANIASRLIAAWIAKTKASFADDVTGDTAAELLDGESPANINAIMQQAVNIMIERMARIGVASNVTLDDIEQARSVVSGE
jgi:transitional endoplasmic reticulum ATPase